MLKEALNETMKAAADVAKQTTMPLDAEEVGVVTAVTGSIIDAVGLKNLKAEETVLIGKDQLKGIAYNLLADEVGIVALEDSEKIQAGDKIIRTNEIVRVPVGNGLLGRVVDALGRPLDGKGQIVATDHYRVEREAAPIMHRKAVSEPLQTGLKAIDSIIQIGRGQRELILGDRQTGKTAVAVDTIINQKGNGVICIYCSIGQRGSATAQVIEKFKEAGVIDQVITVVAGGEDSPGMQFLAPYSATSMGEYFMEKEGKDVLIVYDNLTVHAEAYRQMSLYLRRPPGREAFPGDIFYIHARLLERSTRLLPEHGGGSLTALPICETLAENVSAYIPTNLISITDGQIFLSSGLFQKGMMPAIDVGISVSRVGSKAQIPAYKAVSGPLKMFYAQFEELEAFAKFGTQLDADTQKSLTRGERVREILKQGQYEPLAVEHQVIIVFAATTGLLDGVPRDQVGAMEKDLIKEVPKKAKALMKKITDRKKLSGEDKDELAKAVAEVITAKGFEAKADQ
ncbi:MAG: F0F1 ATP synthase subunit alpha [Alphaproteobacteria bacterium]|nr:F0F1 ATP synthase subunit alpha [Alphaproteobacteria bacterium]MBN2780245.1 F0F1 ATP synthase subunit alpha [Alphaproteobacteria bacterium]